MRRRDRQAAAQALAEPLPLDAATFRQAAKSLGETASAFSMVADGLNACDMQAVATGLALIAQVSAPLSATVAEAKRQMAALGWQYLRAGAGQGRQVQP